MSAFDDRFLRDATGRFLIALHRQERSDLSTWALSSLLNRLASQHYKLELIGSLRAALQSGVPPDKILVFSRSAPLSARVDNSRNRTLTDLLFESGDSIGAPFALAPNPFVDRIREGIRLHGQMLKLFEAQPLEYRPRRFGLFLLCLALARERRAPQGHELTGVFERPPPPDLFERAERLMHSASRPREADLFAEAPATETLFVRTFQATRRPVLVVLDGVGSEESRAAVLCADLLREESERPLPLVLRSFSQNSPADVVIEMAGAMVLHLMNRRRTELENELLEVRIGTERHGQIQAGLVTLQELARTYEAADRLRKSGHVQGANYLEAQMSSLMSQLELNVERNIDGALRDARFGVASVATIDVRA